MQNLRQQLGKVLRSIQAHRKSIAGTMMHSKAEMGKFLFWGIVGTGLAYTIGDAFGLKLKKPNLKKNELAKNYGTQDLKSGFNVLYNKE